MTIAEYVNLGDVADFYAGASLPDGIPFEQQVEGYLLARVSDMNLPGNEVKLRSTQRWSASPGAKSATCPGESLIIPKRGGAIGTNKKRIAARPCVLDPNLMGIKPHSDVLDIRFLYYWFLRFDLLNIANGSSIPQLNKKDLRPLKIPLPPIDVQRVVADVLDKAEMLRAKRRRAIALLDDLAQSIFLNMFGNPVQNDRHWPEVRVADFVAGFESGKSISAAQEGELSKYRILKVSAVTSGTFNPEESKPAPPEYVPPESHIVRDGDLLFSRANTSELIGATAIARPAVDNLLLPDKIWRFVWRAPIRIQPIFVNHLFWQKEFRDRIRQYSTGSSGSMKNISQAKVLSIPTGLPPIVLQDSFVERVSALNVIKEGQREQLAELDELFDSLQDRAFRGELWED